MKTTSQSQSNSTIYSKRIVTFFGFNVLGVCFIRHSFKLKTTYLEHLVYSIVINNRDILCNFNIQFLKFKERLI
jgi:hypothetical protein